VAAAAAAAVEQVGEEKGEEKWVLGERRRPFFCCPKTCDRMSTIKESSSMVAGWMSSRTWGLARSRGRRGGRRRGRGARVVVVVVKEDGVGAAMLSMVVLGLVVVVAVIVVGLRPEVIGRDKAEKEGGHTSAVAGRRARRRVRTGSSGRHGCRPTERCGI